MYQAYLNHCTVYSELKVWYKDYDLKLKSNDGNTLLIT